MTIAAIYARVSTEEQGRTGYSLADQVGACRQKLLSSGITNIEEYIDPGSSGEFLDRPALDRLRNDLDRGKIKTVIVYDPDRLSRNLSHMLLLADEITSAKASLDFVTGSYDASPEGRLFFSMRGAVAQFEKDKIRERTLRGKKKKALSGKVVIGTPRFGYDWNKEASNYIVNEKEAEIVREIYRLSIDGNGLHKIAKALNEKGILNKRGNPFTFKNAYIILTDELYAGTYYLFRSQWTKTGQHEYTVSKKDKSEWIGVPVPAIVDADTFANARAALKSNKKHSRRNRHRAYLLTGLVKCKLCSRNLVASPNSNGLQYYICNGKRQEHKCPDSGWIPADILEKAIWNKLVEIAKTNPPIATILRQSPVPDRNQELAELSEQQRRLKRRKTDITVLIAKGLIEMQNAEDALKSLNRDLNELSEQIAAIRDAIKNIPRNINFNPSDILDAKTVHEKKKLLRDMGITWYVYIPNRLKKYGKNLEINWRV